MAPTPAMLLAMQRAEVARRQAGVLTRRQCRLTGLSNRQIDRLLLRGDLRLTARRGVLLAAATPASAHQEHWRAALSTGGVVSHISAAECWNISVPASRSAVHVSIDPRRYLAPLAGLRRAGRSSDSRSFNGDQYLSQWWGRA